MFCQNTEMRVKTPNHTSNRRPRRVTCPPHERGLQGAPMSPDQRKKTPRYP